MRAHFPFYLSYFLFFLLSNLANEKADAYNLRQFSSQNGLSNSAILSMCQDSNGLIWIGSCDGLNVFDGTMPRLYQSINEQNSLSGNIISNILEAENGILWIQTNYGLDRLDTRLQTIESFKEFKDINKMAKSRNNGIYILRDDGYIYYFQKSSKRFQKLNTPKFQFEDIREMTIDSSNILWIFSSNSNHKSYLIEENETEVKLTPCTYFQHPEKLLWVSSENDFIYFIDQTYALYEYDLNNRRKYYIADLEPEIPRRGEVSSVIRQHNDYYIGFKSSGLIQLKYLPNQKVKYIIQPIDIQSGIFCLMKDKFQDIIWVGTDGQGVYMSFINSFSIKNTLLNTPAYQINNPVRALFLDDEQTLWIGTKGNGILRMLNYHQESDPPSANPEYCRTDNSALTDNSVYCFARSRKKRLWIGTENGTNYYSYTEKKLKNFPITANGKTVKYVHSICELNDTTLWMATVGEGIVKVILDISTDSPKVKNAKRFIVEDGKRVSNYFFTSFLENDSTLWFGNRGRGAYRVNTITGQMTPYLFNRAVKSQTINDIFAIHKNDKGYWFGTSFGLTGLDQGQYRVYNESDGFPNNTIHGILEGNSHDLWLSTNQGIVRFNTQTNTVQTYRQQNDLKITEFSDGAYFKDNRTGALYFGGINGFVTINENNFIPTEYLPSLKFNRLFIFGKEYNIYDFLQDDKSQKVLQLNYNQNFFSLSFFTIDYINGNNYSYYYKIAGLSDEWIENGLSTTATFSNLSPGQYTLLVKYKNNITGKESTPETLSIHITPPWYATSLAYWVYSLLLITSCIWIICLVIRKYRRKRDAMIEEMNRQQRSEVYESKLRFFTNITHEFCTPLTLIYGPCEKILSYAPNDGYIQKYALMIQQNAQKLNALILELIEFRRLETGHKVLEIQHIPVAEHTQKTAESFNELAERKRIDYQVDIKENTYWNTDTSCLSKIVNNLLSNAFKYTPENGSILIEQYIADDFLYIKVANTGKGIKQDDLTKIFDRYKILDNFEIQNKDGISPRNGLGLAICHSMVTLLKGDIKVTSVPDGMTTFEISLPILPVTDDTSEDRKAVLQEMTIIPEEKHLELESSFMQYDSSKQTLMIIDDDPSMLWFITEIFTGQYNVLPCSDAGQAIEKLKMQQPSLILSDVMMPGIDGISFAQQLKSDNRLQHIPLILLSALNSMDDQMKGIDSGAEAYITKPFSAEYLKKVVERFIQREKDLKKYYNSIFSSFKLEEGQFVHEEDRIFFDKMIKVIDDNLLNPELSVDLLSSLLGYSTRHFYRKLKDITSKSPADIIKEYRLAMAEHLLVTTQLSIEEIMDKTGFFNRGTFYKLFSSKNGITPRQYREQQKQSLKTTKVEKVGYMF